LKKVAKFQRSQDSRTFFQIRKSPLLNTFTGHAKCRHFSRQGAHIDLHSKGRKNRKSRNTLNGLQRYLKEEFKKSEKRARILGSSGFWNFFRFEKFHL
jgi:hypothetical protein